MRSLGSIRERLARLTSTMPNATDDHLFHGTSEQAFAEVQRLLAEVEANPSTAPQPFNPADYSPEDAALILKVERMQSELLASERRP